MAAAQPMSVRGAEFADPSLTVNGNGWSLSAVCPWRVRRGGELWFSWSSENASLGILDLVGMNLIAVEPAAGSADPKFIFGDSVEMEFFADSDLDPWVLIMPGKTYVGSVSPQSYNSD
ncbi:MULTISPECIES: hypothetical protein [unclassified Saccharopolyspora]|uniref:hypothetical protein n=1 Tax=unclassified Saccharopolyspora TaxID=2646250 RepID=UPI001CD21FB0|nr:MULTISPECIES: hypothetical protein [unclassified Saccharopolyspora]MCA1195767.1 hypothetical protein [Saccharopolyspora sp. 6V]MCA1279406.1 hypothetical protein [Saccharopolyspora sp. 7B]